MPFTILDANSIGGGTRYTSTANNTDYLVLQDVIVASTDDGQGFYLTGNDNDVEVRGTVSAFDPIFLGDARPDVGQHLHVTGTGRLIGTRAAASLYGSSRVENEGEIRGFSSGLVVGPGSTSTARVVNDGLIQGYSIGLVANAVSGAVARDVRYDLVSPERAQSDYGVVLQDGRTVDAEATETLRAQMRQERGEPEPFSFGFTPPERVAAE